MTQISWDGNKSSPDRGQGVFVLVFFFFFFPLSFLLKQNF